MSIRSLGPIALTVASGGSEGPSGADGVAASMRSRSERRTRYMRPAFTWGNRLERIDTGNPDAAGNYYFSRTQKLSKKRYRIVNWTFGPRPD
jgi:hypothetical protein